MAVPATKVNVGTTATALHTGQSADQSVAVAVPTGGVTVYIGDASVDTTDGFPLAAGDKFTADLDNGEILYGIVASGTQDVNVFRAGAS